METVIAEKIFNSENPIINKNSDSWLQHESSKSVKICYHSYKLIIFMVFVLIFLIFIFIREIKNENIIFDLINKYINKTNS